MTENLSIWNTLGKTDPAQTKRFNRAGGFKGTSVKPVYTDKKMTERFGPVGIGWGMTKPEYSLITGPDGEVVVHCTVALWYVENGQKSDLVWGQGGDMAIQKNQYGLRADDEAYKKAYTDALGNAMKRLGMSADVHMGQHDDDKYVTALRREFEEPAPKAAPEDPAVAEWRSWVETFLGDLKHCATVDAVNELAEGARKELEALQAFNNKTYGFVLKQLDQRRHILAQAPGKAA